MRNQTASNEEILGLERKFWDSMCRDDFDGIMGLTDFPCLLAGPQGSKAFEKDEFRKMFEAGRGKMKNYRFDDDSVEVRQLSPDTAVIAYKVKSTFLQDGREKTVEAADTSTWIRRDGHWACAMHTETELPRAK